LTGKQKCGFAHSKNFNHKGAKTPSFENEIFLCALASWWFNDFMFSHIVIFWTDPAKPGAVDEVIAGANKYLKTIPGLTHFHIGKMIGSTRPVVDQTYQVALNLTFPGKEAEQAYQVHPQHLEFVAHCVKPFVKKVTVYDFE
jgi:hypothetical protein